MRKLESLANLIFLSPSIACVLGICLIAWPLNGILAGFCYVVGLALLIDGRQFLLAHLLRGGAGVFSATSSANPAVARALYDHANSDFHHYAFRPFLETAGSVAELRAAYERLGEVFPPAGDLGFKDFLEEFNGEPQEEAKGLGSSEGSGA